MTTSSKELLHKLNNQLGVILAHAELLETKAQDASQKARASQVVNAALQAMAVSRELRETVGDENKSFPNNPRSLPSLCRAWRTTPVCLLRGVSEPTPPPTNL